MREMVDISTTKTRSGQYSHIGKCKECQSEMTKFVKTHEFQVVVNKKLIKRMPKNMFIGTRTPNIIKEEAKIKQRAKKDGKKSI